MQAVFNGQERSPPANLEVELPCFDGWSTPLQHRRPPAEALENKDEHDSADERDDSAELFARRDLPPTYASALLADADPNALLTNANAVALFQELSQNV